MVDSWEEYKAAELDYLPWKEFTQEKIKEQVDWQKIFIEKTGAKLGKDCFVSPKANIYGIEKLVLGERTFVAAGCLLREISLETGVNCSFNTGAYIQGKVTLGNDVRIAPDVKIIAMNHSFEDTSVPLFKQPITQKGIVIEDDVWVGAGVIVLDGVKIGAHSVVGAGAVVTKNISPWSVAVGNPAKVVKNRLTEVMTEKRLEEASTFFQKVSGQLPVILSYYTSPENSVMMVNEPSQPINTRAQCDAVELCAMLNYKLMPEERKQKINLIQSLQMQSVDYDVLTTGYALEVLGAKPRVLFAEATEISQNLFAWFGKLPFVENAWTVGAEIDHLATALYFNKKYFPEAYREGSIEELFGLLAVSQSKKTGLWGSEDDLHLAVNGFYRLARGSYAQFGVAIPQQEKILDSILRHSTAIEENGTACDVLDVIWPLWVLQKSLSGTQKAQAVQWAEKQLERIFAAWQENKGFSFELSKEYSSTLQGTEMWLSILWYLCDFIKAGSMDEFSPKGVHFPNK